MKFLPLTGLAVVLTVGCATTRKVSKTDAEKVALTRALRKKTK